MQRKFKWPFLAIGLSLLPLSVFAAATETLNLGTGYSSDLQSAVNNCLKPGIVTYQGAAGGELKLNYITDFKQLQKQLNIDISVSGGVDVFSGSDSVSFARYVEEDSMSRSFVYSEILQFPSAKYNIPSTAGMNDALKPTYRKLTAQPMFFREVCGDQFVAQVDYGAGLFVALKMQFQSREDKTTFNNALSGSVSMVNFSSTIKSITERHHLQGSVVVRAIQKGGDPSQLAKIFNDGSGKTAPIFECSFKDLADCTAAINDIINYATDDQVGFPSQLRYIDGKTPKDAAPMHYILENYSRALVFVESDTKLSEPIKAARKQLAEKFLSTLKQQKFVNDILSGKSNGYLTSDYKEKIHFLKENISDNYDVLQSTGLNCYLHLSTCVSNANDTLQNLKPVDLTPFTTLWKNRMVTEDHYPVCRASETVRQWWPVGEEEFIEFGNRPAPYPVKLKNQDSHVTAIVDYSYLTGGLGGKCHLQGQLTDNANHIYKGKFTCTSGCVGSFDLTQQDVSWETQ